jgi:N-alpha-acetyltransferase 15/16, NatA auxiliary subunit
MMKNHKETLSFIEKNESKIVDKISLLEYKGHALFQLEEKEKSGKVYLELLKMNSENYEYIYSYQETFGFVKESKNVPEEQIEGLVKLYDKLLKKFPKAKAIPRLLLNFVKGEEFEKRFKNFVAPYLKKTIPSLFTTVVDLYENKEKVKQIEKIFLEFLELLEKESKLTKETEEIEPPPTYLWCLQYMAMHYSKLGNMELALKYIDQAIEHTPTVLELYLSKGYIYKVNQKLTKEFLSNKKSSRVF